MAANEPDDIDPEAIIVGLFSALCDSVAGLALAASELHQLAEAQEIEGEAEDAPEGSDGAQGALSDDG